MYTFDLPITVAEAIQATQSNEIKYNFIFKTAEWRKFDRKKGSVTFLKIQINLVQSSVFYTQNIIYLELSF